MVTIAWDKEKLAIAIQCKNEYEYGQIMTLLDNVSQNTLWKISEAKKKNGEN